jgi:ABC-type Zn uptake system ZnuABC Zn-binding protein ZnuA
MMKRILIFVVAAFLITASASAQSKLNVVTSTEDLASIAREVGGDRIAVESIARGYQDPHFVEAKPSFILKLQKTDLLIVVGRELEIGWLPPLIQQSRNSKIQPGANGYLDASLTASILEIPTGQLTRAMGDVHPQGNPHYWLDPENGKRVAKSIGEKLGQLRPNDQAYFDQRLGDFSSRLEAAQKRWLEQLAPYKGTKIVTYHRSFPNFAERFGLVIVGYVEPRPGIPPTPQHTLDLMNEMKRQNIKLILVEPYFDSKTPNAIARDTGAQVLTMPPSVGGVKEVTDLLQAVRLRRQPRRRGDQEERSGEIDGNIDARVPGGAVRRQPHSDRDSRLSRGPRGGTWRHFCRSLAGADRGARGDDRPAVAGVGRRSARPGGVLDQPRVHLHGRVCLCDGQAEGPAHSAGGDYRYLLRRRLGGGDRRDE